ncbi:MAG: hypothetical protein KG003_13480 [Bacteroidetes bacterium]|nr:hypothetical protein [Bacteroidota bacterium]
MKFFKLTSLALLGAMTFAGCKYEEGPRISLRAKRDRVANEWAVKKYTYEGEDRTTQLIDAENGFTIVINLGRAGGYGLEIVKKTEVDGKTKYITNHTYDGTHFGFDACCHIAYTGFRLQMPSHIQYLMPGGKWTFDKGHYKIQVKPELSYDNENMTQKNTIDWAIVMLKEKAMKVKGRDENDKEWILELEAINDEPYFY